jgi:hypothetical protein
MSISPFTLTSPTSQVAAPFVVGQAFRRGDVPAGAQLVGNFADLQVTPKNTWSDGSLKFAIIAGRANLTANVAKTVRLSSGAQGGAALSTADLKATGVTAAVGAGAFGTVSWSGTDWDSPWQTWVAGPRMSSWIYRKPVGTDPHLVAFLEVRLFSGGEVEVLPWVENGYLTVAGPTNKAATFTFTLGGTQRVSTALDLKHHTRTPLIAGTALSYWLGADPDVTPRHDVLYLQASELVPTYGATSVSTALSGGALAASYAPFQPGGFVYDSDAMGSSGYQSPIGLLPTHDVAYLTCSDNLPLLYGSVVRNGFSAGRYPIHYRDQATNRPAAFSSWSHLVIGDNQGFNGNGSSTTGQVTPATSGGNGPNWDVAHSPSVGYLAYLLTGRWYFMEEVQFAAVTNYLGNGDSSILRQGSKGLVRPCPGAWQTRCCAWAWRALAQALCVTPDADTALRNEFIASAEYNIADLYATYVAQPNNRFGLIGPGESYDGTLRLQAIWQQDFVTAAFGWSVSMDLPVSSTHQARLASFFQWKAKSVLFRLGVNGGFWYVNGAPYVVAISPASTPDYAGGAGPWYATDNEVYQATYYAGNAVYASPPSFLSATEGVLGGEYTPDTWGRSMWGNLQPAIAYAVRHAVPGAQAAYDRMTGASNYAALTATFTTAPAWSVQPLAGTSTMSTPGPSFIWDTATLIPGAFVWDTVRGHGITAAQLPTGFPDEPLLTRHIPAGANPASEYRWMADSVPPGLNLTVYPDSSFIASGADGATYTGAKTVYRDGVADTGSYSFTFGAPTVTAVIVAPGSPTLAGGASQQFTAIVNGTASPSQAVTWSKVSGAGTLSSAGLYTAPPATGGVQTAVIRATANQDGTTYADVTVTISAASATVSSVTVTPNPIAVAGGAMQSFAAVVNGTGSPSQAVTWNASAGSIDGNGKFTAPAATSSAQTISVSATSNADPGKTGTATITVPAAGIAAPTVTSVSVTPSSATMAGSTARGFIAAVNGSNNPSPAVTWTCSAGAIDSNGLFTAPAPAPDQQTVTVTATSVQDNSKSGSAAVTVAAQNAARELTTVALTVFAFDEHGGTLAGAPVRAKLTRTDIDPVAGYVVPEEVFTTTDASGVAVLRLWPNALGANGSKYLVRITNPDTGRVLRLTASLPNADCLLHQVADPLPATR